MYLMADRRPLFFTYTRYPTIESLFFGLWVLSCTRGRTKKKQLGCCLYTRVQSNAMQKSECIECMTIGRRPMYLRLLAERMLGLQCEGHCWVVR
jgi:hypothetical protein